MANKVRGERVLRGEENYTVVFTSNAIAQAESEIGYGVGQMIGNMMTGAFSINEIRTLLWAGLLKHHGPLSIPDAGEILDEILLKGQDLGKVLEEIAEALNEALPFKVEEGDNPNVAPVALQTGSKSKKAPAKARGTRSSKTLEEVPSEQD